MRFLCRFIPDRFLRIVGSLIGFAALSAVMRADRLELDRNTPVPESQKIPTADFFRVPLLFNPEINSDGTDIAAQVTTTLNNVGLLNYEIATKKFETIGLPSNQDVGSYGWLGSSRLFYTVTVDKHFGTALFGANLRNFPTSYPIFQYDGAMVVAIPPADPTFPLVWLRSNASDQGRDEGVVTANTNLDSSPAVKLSSELSDWSSVMEAEKANERHIKAHYPIVPGFPRFYYISPDGDLKYAVASQGGYDDLYRLEGAHWVKSAINLHENEFVLVGTLPDQVLINVREANKPRALRFADAKTGVLGEALFQDESYDFVGNIYRDPVTHEMVGVTYQRNGPTTKWFNDEYRHIQKVVDASFPGKVVRLLSSDNKKNIFVAMVYSDRQPPIYYVINLSAKTIGPIKSAEPWVDEKRMQPVNIIKFKTRDGHHLDAYLTLPKGASKTHLPPLVVVPHGGPWVRDIWGYDGETQFLVARGYAVLKPNYRGSPGYDWMFPHSDLWDFQKMHDDVTDVTKAVMASGYVDPNRVAIMGGSFGGYLALSGAVNEPGLYKCAVTIAGVFDWSRLMNEKKSDQYSSPEYEILKRGLGDPAKAKEHFDAISPLRHVDQVKIPVFVAAGTEDERVDVSESRSLVSELDKHHVPHEEMIVFQEGHGMHHIENEVTLYDRIDAFLRKYLSPDPVLVETAIAH